MSPTISLTDLIERMNDPVRPGNNSTEWVSWRAYREAETLSEPGLLAELAEIFRQAKAPKVREAVAFIVGCIGKNSANRRAAELLLDFLAGEADKYVLSTTLLGLAKQSDIPADPVLLNLASEPRAFVRHAALEALGSCHSAEAETWLCQILETSPFSSDLITASAALNKLGAKRAVPNLVKLVQRPEEDLRCAALAALRKIGDSSLTPVFLEALSHKSGSTKWYAMLALAQHGDQTAFEAVYQRVLKIIARQRQIEQGPLSELQAAFEYLWRFRDKDERVEKLLHKIWLEKRFLLFESERNWLEDKFKS